MTRKKSNQIQKAKNENVPSHQLQRILRLPLVTQQTGENVYHRHHYYYYYCKQTPAAGDRPQILVLLLSPVNICLQSRRQI